MSGVWQPFILPKKKKESEISRRSQSPTMRYATQSRRFIRCVTSFSKEIKNESDIFVDAKMKCQTEFLVCVNFLDAHSFIYCRFHAEKKRSKTLLSVVTKQLQLSEHYSLLQREKVEISHKAAKMLTKEKRKCTFDAATLRKTSL